MFAYLNKTETSLRSQSFYLFAGKVLAFAVQFLVPILLVRTLTKSEFGLYRLALTISYTLIPILQMGLNSSLYYFYPISKEKKTQLLIQTFYLLLSIGSMALLIYLTTYRVIDKNFASAIRHPVVFPLSLMIYFLLISTIIEHIFILETKAILNAFYLVAEQIVRCFFIIVPVFYYRTAYHALWGLVGFAMLRSALFLFYFAYNYKNPFKIKDTHFIFQQIRYSIPIASGNMLGEIGRKIDRFIVSGLVGVTNFATYSVATVSVPLINLFFNSIFRVAMPKLSSYGAVGDKKSAKILWHNIVYKASLVTIPGLIFFEIMAEQIITILFTSQYIDSVVPYRILLLSLLFQMTGYGLISRAFNKTRVYIKAGIIMLIVGVILGIVLTKLYGIIGAAISAVVAFGALTVTILYADKKILELRFFEWLPFNQMICLLGTSLICAFPLVAFNIFAENISYFITLPSGLIIYTLSILYLYNRKSYISINKNVLLKITRKGGI